MQYVSIKDLKKNPNNPRIVKNEEFSKLKDSLRDEEGKKHFEARPVIVSTRTGENIIIAGNTRFQAAKELGWQEIPTVIIHNLTEEREKEIIIRDNVNNGEWDVDTLYNEWDVDLLEEWGLNLPEMNTPEETEEEPKGKLPTLKISAANKDDLDMIKEEIEPIILRYIGAYLE